MTAALVHFTGSALRLRWRAFGALLAIALPVPLFAALGLSLPLPATVERIAAKLVPFATEILDSGSSQGSRSNGTIVLASGDRRPVAGEPGSDLTFHLPGTPPGRPSAGPRAGTERGVPPSEIGPPSSPATSEHGGASAPASDGNQAPSGESVAPTEEAPPPGSGDEPGPAPSPGPVETVAKTADDVVTTATDVVSDTTTTAVDTVHNTAGGLLPP